MASATPFNYLYCTKLTTKIVNIMMSAYFLGSKNCLGSTTALFIMVYSAEIAATRALSGGASKYLRTRSRSSCVSTPASGSKEVT
jgi:hypothetical protein